jgi:hypothetical protein
MKPDNSWSLDIKSVYSDPEPLTHGPLTYHFDSVLKYVRVAVKSGSREVLIFHAVRPDPERGIDEDNYIMTFKTLSPNKTLNFNPLEQLLADAELGRRVREAGLELKE